MSPAMKKASILANGSKDKFLQLFEEYVEIPVLQNPILLRKAGWK